MKVYRDLKIQGTSEQLQALVTEMDKVFTDEWTRELEMEERWCRDMLSPSSIVRCYSCPERGLRTASTLFLTSDEDGRIRVTNIVPEAKELSRDQYNAILEEFYKSCVLPAATRVELSATLTPKDKALTDWVSEETMRRLQQFSRIANQSSLHPYDEQRWIKSIISAHIEDSELDAEMLRRWFVEEQGWAEERASKLAAQYEFARQVLAAYQVESRSRV
jgi:hypothetical protein